MDTFVHIKGILKEPIRVYGPWWPLIPPRITDTFKSMKFSVEHRTEQELYAVVDKVMTDITHNQGMYVIADESLVTKKASNLQFWPMDNFHHIEVETRLMAGPPVQGLVQ